MLIHTRIPDNYGLMERERDKEREKIIDLSEKQNETIQSLIDLSRVKLLSTNCKSIYVEPDMNEENGRNNKLEEDEKEKEKDEIRTNCLGESKSCVKSKSRFVLLLFCYFKQLIDN